MKSNKSQMNSMNQPTADNRNARTRARSILAAIVAAIAMFAIAPTAAQAVDGLSNVNTNNTSISGQTLNFGVNGPGSYSPNVTIYLWTNSASGGILNLSTRKISVDIRLNSNLYERNGGNCGSETPAAGYTFRATYSYQGGASFRSCQINLRLKNTAPTGTHNTTLDYANVGTGAANIIGSVTEDAGNAVRVVGPAGETSSVNFGGVAVGDSVSRTFTVRNSGVSAVNGMGANTAGSTEFSVTGTTCTSLNLGQTCTVDVRYQPTVAGTGQTGTLNITSSSGAARSISLTGDAFTPVAELSVTPMSIDFGGASVGTPAFRPVTLQNTGNTTLTLSAPAGVGSDPAVFYRGSGGTCAATLAVGASCVMRLAFDPAATGGDDQSGSIDVTGSTPLVVEPAVESVSLSGTRVAPATSFAVQNTAGNATLTSQQISSVVGATGSYAFTIRNTGNVTIPNVTASFTGEYASRFSVTGTTCGGALLRDETCTITVTYNAVSGEITDAVAHFTAAAGSLQADPHSVSLTGRATAVQIANDQTINMTGITQKRWLETPSLSPGGGTPSDIVRVSFDVNVAEDADIAGVQMATATTITDTAPAVPYDNIGDLLAGQVQVERKPGSSHAVVTASVPLSSSALGTGNGNYGFANGVIVEVFGVPVSCTAGDYDSNDRRFWFRVVDSNGGVSQPVGSQIDLSNQNFGCPNGQGAQLSGTRILSVGGASMPTGTYQATAQKNQSATFQFTTRAKGASALETALGSGSPANVEGINWRIRNIRTGAMFRIVNGSYTACSAPCTDESNFTSGGKLTFASAAQGTQTLTIPGIPSRGRWSVEAAAQSSGGDERDNRFYSLGSLKINDHGASSPTVSFGGTLGARPDSDSSYTIVANTSDPTDPVNTLDSEGGRSQVIEWDLDGDHSNGPLGDGFERRFESNSGTNLPSNFITRAFDTTGKTPGPYTIRVRVTDNGAFSGSDSEAETRTYEYNTTINSLPVPTDDVYYVEADQAQPYNTVFNATDVDGDDYKVSITPNGANDGTMGGNLNAGLGENTKPYTWPADYTGTDTFEFTPTDDHLGTGESGTLSIRVRPNTTIDTSTIAGTLFHPDLGANFLGSTTDTSASFDFSSPQNPVVAYECRHLLDGNVLADWSECSDQDTGSIEFDDLGDGLHRVEVRAINDEGVEDGTPAFRTWRVDNTSPLTEVRVGPPSNLPNQQPRFTNDPSPTYIFRATAAERSLQNYITYECRLLWGPEEGNWKACGAPADNLGSGPVDIVGNDPDFGITEDLPEGTYSMEVRATDEVGNLGQAMVESFTVDVTAPETALASGPEGLVNSRSLNYVVSSSQGQSTFLCRVVGQDVGVVLPLGPCPSSAADGSRPSFTVPDDGHYTLYVTAVDPAQNQDPSPLEVDFEVDATEPTTTMDGQVNYGNGPTSLRRTQSRHVDITFAGFDSRKLAGFQCRIDSTDDEAWQICESIQRFGGLSDGPHKAEIRARDEAGNVDSTPEVLEWIVDRNPPTTTITQAPDAVTNDADPTFEFTVNEDATSVCTVDGGAPMACDSPVGLAELGVTGTLEDGNHSFTVRSTDLAGNIEATVATASWSQDTTVPEVNLNSKPGAYTPVGDVQFGWSVKDGNPLTDAPEAQSSCAVDPADPDDIQAGEWESCARSLSISEADNTNGEHRIFIRATDEAGNVSPTVSHTWTVLGSKPVAPVVNNSSPVDGATTRATTAYFAFSHELDETGALEGMFCSVDGSTAVACQNNYSVDGLADGTHTFSVVARDIGGNESDPTVINWEVQSTAPVTSIDSGPSGITNQSEVSFEFTSDRAGTFECKVDGSAWTACTSPAELQEMSEGEHKFSVRAVSMVAPVGVKDPTPPSRTWTVDKTAPTVVIDSSPSGVVNVYDAKFVFHSSETDSAFECRVGSDPWATCTSPYELSALPAGQTTVEIRAVDAAGNTSETASRTWTIEDPVCPNGFEGTPPDCTEIAPVQGPGIKGKLTTGSLSLATLGSVPLPEGQLELTGKRGSDGRWQVPQEGVNFLPVEQTIPDALGPGTMVAVVISISATGDGWGTLPSGGGAAKFKLPVRADVQAKVGGADLLPPGSECSLKPITFDLTGTYDEAASSVSLSSPSVAFPKVTGCGSFKTVVDNLLELPRDDIEISMDLALEDLGEEACPAGQVGTPPNCVKAAANLAKPKVTISKKKIKGGKKVAVKVSVANSGNTTATNAQVCLGTPKSLVKGKAQRCKTIKTIAAGKSGTVGFNIATKKVSRSKRANLVVTSPIGDGSKRTKVRGHVTVLK